MKFIKRWIENLTGVAVENAQHKIDKKLNTFWCELDKITYDRSKKVEELIAKEKENRLLSLKRAADKAREFRESMCEWKNDSTLKSFNTDNRLSSLDQRWAEIEGRLFKIERQLKALSDAE